MVFLHGGAFVFDSGSAYSGAALSASTGVVVVSVNYRLGPLGFGWDPPRVARRYSPPTPFDGSFIAPVESFVGAFARTGDPNAAGIPSWPRFERSTEGYLRIKEPLEIGHRVADADCDFWDGIYERQLRARSDAPPP
jgi:carboxylesterase type B